MNVESTVVVQRKAGQAKITIEAVFELNEDDTRTELEWQIEPVSFSTFVLARTMCHIPLSFLHSNGNREICGPIHQKPECVCLEKNVLD